MTQLIKQKINISLAKKKNILPDNYKSSNDTLEVLNQLLELIKNKYNLDILIQSGLEFKKDKIEWQCLIGRKLTDYDCAHTFSNGLGNTIGDAIINSLNEFIEYYGINKKYLSQ